MNTYLANCDNKPNGIGSMILRSVTFVILSLCIIAFTGCKGGVKVSDDDIQVIDFDDLQRLLKNKKKNTVLVDVRRPEVFSKGHIAGAINIPIIEMKEADPRLAEAHHIVAYSGRFDDNLSLPGAKKLMALRYSNIYDFRGGYDMWKEITAKDAGE